MRGWDGIWDESIGGDLECIHSFERRAASPGEGKHETESSKKKL